MTCPMLLSLLLPGLLLSCGKDDGSADDTQVDEADTDTDTDTDTDSDTDTDADTDADTDTDTDTDTDPTPDETGVEVVSIDKKNFADFGYELVTYQVTDEAPDPYDSLFDGEQPTFYVWRPMDVSPDEELPLLVWFHGGAIGDDTAAESGGDFPDACSYSNITEDFIATNLQGPSKAPKLAADRRWAMVLVRNDWCDAWQGWGPDDPVDPERHYGYYHAARTMDWLREGHAGFEVDDDKIFGWGTSAGSTAAVIAASRYPEMDAVAFDSGLSSFITYYERAGTDYGTTTAEMEHIFGGAPYDEDGEPNGEVYERYQAASPDSLILDGGLRIPIFIAWNNMDANVGAVHAQDLISAVSATYGEDTRWYAHDYNHQYPGDRGHVQTIYAFPPLGYSPYAIFEFFDGYRVAFVEAEEGCARTECVGDVIDDSLDTTISGFSQALGREGGPGESGLLYSGPMPPGLAAGHEVRVSMAMKATGHETLDPATEIGKLVYVEGGVTIAEEPLLAGNLSVSGASDAEVINQYDNSWLSFEVGDPAQGELKVFTYGLNTLRLDMAIYLYK
jgi:acetyl esterase/lipase